MVRSGRRHGPLERCAFQERAPPLAALHALVSTTMKINCEKPNPKAPIVARALKSAEPAARSQMRRAPARPRKCIGKKVMLKNTIEHQKWILPRRSSAMCPVHFGSQ